MGDGLWLDIGALMFLRRRNGQRSLIERQWEATQTFFTSSILPGHYLLSPP